MINMGPWRCAAARPSTSDLAESNRRAATIPGRELVPPERPRTWFQKLCE